MIYRFLLVCSLFCITTLSFADNRYLLSFELAHNGKNLKIGKTLVTREKHTWSSGLKRSYLKIRCEQQKSGEVKKLYSTVDLFAGLLVFHQIVKNHIELKVSYNIIQPGLNEIRDLKNHECKDLSPFVTTITKNYRLLANGKHKASHTFGKNMIFKTSLKSTY